MLNSAVASLVDSAASDRPTLLVLHSPSSTNMSVLTSQKEADLRRSHECFTNFGDACFQTSCCKDRVEAAFFIAATLCLSLLLKASNEERQALARFHEQDEGAIISDVNLTALDGFASVKLAAQVHIRTVRINSQVTCRTERANSGVQVLARAPHHVQCPPASAGSRAGTPLGWRSKSHALGASRFGQLASSPSAVNVHSSAAG